MVPDELNASKPQQVSSFGCWKKTIEKQISKSNLTYEKKTVIELGIEIDCQLNCDVHINSISDLTAAKRYNTFGLCFG